MIYSDFMSPENDKRIWATVAKETRNGHWIAITDDCTVIGMSGRDWRLSEWVKVAMDNIKEGDGIHFPDGKYGVLSPLKHGEYSTPAVIESDHIFYNSDDNGDYWRALACPGMVNLEKATGPKDVGIGTMVRLHTVRKGVNHNWCSEWDIGEEQYNDPITHEQEQLAEKIYNENNLSSGIGTGTVLLISKKYLIIRKDNPQASYDIISYISRRNLGHFSPGTHIVYGSADSEYSYNYMAFSLEPGDQSTHDEISPATGMSQYEVTWRGPMLPIHPRVIFKVIENEGHRVEYKPNEDGTSGIYTVYGILSNDLFNQISSDAYIESIEKLSI